MMKKLLILLILIESGICLGQSNGLNAYWIAFTDKNNSVYDINKPEEFLSTRAIERRKRYHIAVDESDLPVNKTYIDGLLALNVKVRYASKWMNGVVIDDPDSLQLLAISALPFVKNNIRVSKHLSQSVFKYNSKQDNSAMFRSSLEPFNENYGLAWSQINMMNGDFLHLLGYTGQGVSVAIMDGGFNLVNNGIAFKHLFDNDRINNNFDFSGNQSDVYDFHWHGSAVLSCMAANYNGKMIGTAPNASYMLLRTEVVDYELIVEEYNWLRAAEYADSLGADVFNTSLGYTQFDDAEFDHEYSDLDGNTTIITRAADKAASKGILVVNSAGNSGDDPWKYISAPADGDSVFTIGAVNPTRQKTGFSSVGPTADGRIKPDVMAQGQGVAINYGDTIVGYSSGTSFSSPVLCGLMACLWQAFPVASNMELIETVRQSSSQYSNPDNDYGYGIPNFRIAFNILAKKYLPFGANDENEVKLFPNPSQGNVFLQISSTTALPEVLNYKLFNTEGQKMDEGTLNTLKGNFEIDRISLKPNLQNGVYMLQLNGDNYFEVLKVVILQ